VPIKSVELPVAIRPIRKFKPLLGSDQSLPSRASRINLDPLGSTPLTIFKELDDQKQEWGAYNPELNYIERIKMSNSANELYDVIITRYRRCW
jgi:hypothetical protein